MSNPNQPSYQPNSDFPPSTTQPPYPGYQQSGPNSYPQQPPYAQPPKKKNRLWLWLGVGLAALVVLCVAVFAISSHTGSSTTTSGTTSGSGKTSNSTSSKSSSSSSNSTTSGNYKVGQTATSGNWKVTVESVSTSAGDEEDTPKAGNHYLLIKVSETNLGGAQASASSIIQFTLRDTNGQSYDETILVTGNTAPDGDVPANGKVAGTLAYEVPMSIKNFTLSFEGTIGDTAVAYKIKA